MIKAYATTLILAMIFFCPIGYSTHAYIGPYEVSFNNTTHPVYLFSLEPSHELFKNKNNEWNILTRYVGTGTINNSTTSITITEVR
jgi:hypothetical protein